MRPNIALVVLLAAAPVMAQQYTCAVGPTATSTGTINATVTFNASLKGNYDQVTNAGGTRTITGLFGGNTAAPNNQTISPLSGTGGGNGSSATVPTGSMVVRFNAFSRTVDIFNFAVDLNGASTDPSVPISMSLTYPSFRTFVPNYTYIWLGIPVPVPLGSATVLSNTLTQNGRATTTATVGTGGAFDFVIDIPAQSNALVNAGGSDNPVSSAQTIHATGTITPGASGATVSMTFGTNQAQPVTPVTGDPLNPTPFDLPAPSTANPPPPPAHVLMVVNITGGNVAVSGTATLPSSGNRSNLADVGAAGGVLNPDGTLDNNDFVAYVNEFFAGTPVADIGGVGGLAGGDGAFDNNDFVVFVNAFFGG